jgi:hypothetical protein
LAFSFNDNSALFRQAVASLNVHDCRVRSSAHRQQFDITTAERNFPTPLCPITST